jgi:hypothetical protein
MTDERRQTLCEALRQIQDSTGRLTPELVVQHAKDPQSPLHAEFQWDIQKAAELYWIECARTLMRSVMVEVLVDDRPVSVHLYVRDPEAETDKQGYRSILNIRAEPEASKLLLMNEFSQAEAHLERAERIAMVVGGKREVKAALKKTKEMRLRLEASQLEI